MHASTIALLSSAMLEQARRDTHDMSCMSCRDVMQQVELGLSKLTVLKLCKWRYIDWIIIIIVIIIISKYITK